jgi:FG-GAP-like repeat
MRWKVNAMRYALLALPLAMLVALSNARAEEWRVQRIDTPARVSALATVDGQVRVRAGGLWYALVAGKTGVALKFIDKPAPATLPENALPDGRVVVGTRDIARVWLAEPTDRYDHGILGDKIEAGAVVIETRDGKRHTVRLKSDAVFEDLEPRLADLNGDGRDEVVVVKSYLKRGSALAVIGERRGRYEIVAETPPLGAPHRWLDPAGIADFTGDGKADIALVRQPHVVGSLELWSWRDGRLRKSAEMAGFANHIAGTRAIDMAAQADFDGDGVADLALPSLDRTHLRIVSFQPRPREIAGVPLPAKAVTNLGLIAGTPPRIALGLADGSLVLVTRR